MGGEAEFFFIFFSFFFLLSLKEAVRLAGSAREHRLQLLTVPGSNVGKPVSASLYIFKTSQGCDFSAGFLVDTQESPRLEGARSAGTDGSILFGHRPACLLSPYSE